MATMTVPEIEIVDVAAGTEATADFTTFFRAEYPGLVALATAVLSDRQAGEDVAAEAMARAYHRWTTVGTYDRPGAWTRRVTINLLHSRRRRMSSEIKALLRLRNRRPGADAGQDDLIADHTFQRLLSPLAPRQRTAAALHYLDDLSVDEIAELMGCAPGTVKSHLHAARTAIAAALSDEEESS